MSDASHQPSETLLNAKTPGGPPEADGQRLQALFEAWILLRDQGRDVPAAELCRDCPHLAAALAEEIALHRRFEPTAPRTLPSAGRPEPPVNEFAGLRYRPVRYHAQGGLGVVFVARDTEVGRDVALKRIQEHRKHLPQDRERFPREAEITGRLEHPGIVPVYSVGHDASGQPYYTMRFVEGRTLAEAVDAFHRGEGRPRSAGERNQNLRALLTRFVAVCQTIGYAHSRGVIHRDLKPGNVLLGDYGETLVIDWGLARQTDCPEPAGGSAEDALPAGASSGTQTGAAMGTRGFMSPEQGRGDWASVGPASDVFSLGATLYAILTGQAPCGRTDSLEDARAGRFPRPRQVSRAVPVALEAVCLKAMAARPEGRYAGARELAADVQRWLDDEPVLAYREPVARRVGRWARRHRTPVAAGVVLLMAGVVSLALGLWAVGREQARTAEALEDARKNLELAKANLKLAGRAVDECFNVAKSHPLFQEPRMEQAKKLLLEKTLPFYRHIRAQRPDDPALQREEAEQWFRVGYIELTFLRTAGALTAYEQARDLLAKLVEAHPQVPEYQSDLATTHNDLGYVLETLGERAKAMRAYERAAGLQGKLMNAHPKEPEYQQRLAGTHTNRGNLLRTLGKGEEAFKEYQQARDLQATLVNAYPRVPEYQNALARTHNNRGYVLDGLGKREEAFEAYARAIDLQAKLVRAYPKVPEYQNALARTYNNRGNVFLILGKSEEALKEYRNAHDLQAKLLEAHPELPEYQTAQARTHNNLGYLLDGMGKREDALREYRQANDLQRQLMKAHPEVPEHQNDLARTYTNRGDLLRAMGKAEEALRDYAQAYDLRAKLVRAYPEVPAYTEGLARVCLHRSALLAQMGRYRDSLTDLDQCVARLDRLRRLDPLSAQLPAYLLPALRGRADVLSRLGRPRDADPDWDRLLALTSEARRPELRRNRDASRAGGLALAGDYRGAAAAADELARTPSLSGSTLYDLACALALSASAAARDDSHPPSEREKIADGYARRAVALLEAARLDGFFREPAARAHLDRDDDLTSLRGRDDYRAFVKALSPFGPRENLSRKERP